MHSRANTILKLTSFFLLFSPFFYIKGTHKIHIIQFFFVFFCFFARSISRYRNAAFECAIFLLCNMQAFIDIQCSFIYYYYSNSVGTVLKTPVNSRNANATFHPFVYGHLPMFVTDCTQCFLIFPFCVFFFALLLLRFLSA